MEGISAEGESATKTYTGFEQEITGITSTDLLRLQPDSINAQQTVQRTSAIFPITGLLWKSAKQLKTAGLTVTRTAHLSPTEISFAAKPWL